MNDQHRQNLVQNERFQIDSLKREIEALRGMRQAPLASQSTQLSHPPGPNPGINPVLAPPRPGINPVLATSNLQVASRTSPFAVRASPLSAHISHSSKQPICMLSPVSGQRPEYEPASRPQSRPNARAPSPLFQSEAQKSASSQPVLSQSNAQRQVLQPVPSQSNAQRQVPAPLSLFLSQTQSKMPTQAQVFQTQTRWASNHGFGSPSSKGQGLPRAPSLDFVPSTSPTIGKKAQSPIGISSPSQERRSSVQLHASHGLTDSIDHWCVEIPKQTMDQRPSFHTDAVPRAPAIQQVSPVRQKCSIGWAPPPLFVMTRQSVDGNPIAQVQNAPAQDTRGPAVNQSTVSAADIADILATETVELVDRSTTGDTIIMHSPRDCEVSVIKGTVLDVRSMACDGDPEPGASQSTDACQPEEPRVNNESKVSVDSPVETEQKACKTAVPGLNLTEKEELRSSTTSSFANYNTPTASSRNRVTTRRTSVICQRSPTGELKSALLSTPSVTPRCMVRRRSLYVEALEATHVLPTSLQVSAPNSPPAMSISAVSQAKPETPVEYLHTPPEAILEKSPNESLEALQTKLDSPLDAVQASHAIPSLSRAASDDPTSESWAASDYPASEYPDARDLPKAARLNLSLPVVSGNMPANQRKLSVGKVTAEDLAFVQGQDDPRKAVSEDAPCWRRDDSQLACCVHDPDPLLIRMSDHLDSHLSASGVVSPVSEELQNAGDAEKVVFDSFEDCRNFVADFKEDDLTSSMVTFGSGADSLDNVMMQTNEFMDLISGPLKSIPTQTLRDLRKSDFFAVAKFLADANSASESYLAAKQSPINKSVRSNSSAGSLLAGMSPIQKSVYGSKYVGPSGSNSSDGGTSPIQKSVKLQNVGPDRGTGGYEDGASPIQKSVAQIDGHSLLNSQLGLNVDANVDAFDPTRPKYEENSVEIQPGRKVESKCANADSRSERLRVDGKDHPTSQEEYNHWAGVSQSVEAIRNPQSRDFNRRTDELSAENPQSVEHNRREGEHVYQSMEYNRQKNEHQETSRDSRKEDHPQPAELNRRNEDQLSRSVQETSRDSRKEDHPQPAELNRRNKDQLSRSVQETSRDSRKEDHPQPAEFNRRNEDQLSPSAAADYRCEEEHPSQSAEYGHPHLSQSVQDNRRKEDQPHSAEYIRCNQDSLSRSMPAPGNQGDIIFAHQPSSPDSVKLVLAEFTCGNCHSRVSSPVQIYESSPKGNLPGQHLHQDPVFFTHDQTPKDQGLDTLCREETAENPEHLMVDSVSDTENVASASDHSGKPAKMREDTEEKVSSHEGLLLFNPAMHPSEECRFRKLREEKFRKMNERRNKMREDRVRRVESSPSPIASSSSRRSPKSRAPDPRIPPTAPKSAPTKRDPPMNNPLSECAEIRDKHARCTGAKPRMDRANRKVIKIAIHNLFQGEPSRQIRETLLASLDGEALRDDKRLLVLFRGAHLGRHDFRALYSFRDDKWTRIVHLLPSPAFIENNMCIRFFRFDCAQREFKELESVKSISSLVDAVFLKPQYLKSRIVPT